MSNKTKIYIPSKYRGNTAAMFNFLVRYITLNVDPMGNQVVVSDAIGMHRNTFWASSQRGHFTTKSAFAIAELVPELDLNPLWLVAPEKMTVNENGELQ